MANVHIDVIDTTMMSCTIVDLELLALKGPFREM